MDNVIDLARAYAEHMDGWHAEPHTSEPDHARLVNDAERVQLAVYRPWRGTRLVIRPAFPYRHRVSGPSGKEITVDPARDPRAVARDIMRRTVPDAIAGTRRWEENIAAQEEREARLARTREAMVAEFPALEPYPDTDTIRFTWSPPQVYDDLGISSRHQYGTVNLWDGDSGDVELHGLTVDQVKRVLRALADNEPC